MAITMEELKRKAKAYDEALENAKDIVNNQNASSVWKDWLRNTFHELRESKGEEIRKNIISYLHNEKKVKRYISDIEFDKWIAWLKSLKDKVQPQPKQDWSEEDEKNFQGIIDEIKANKNFAPDYDIATYDRFLCWLEYIKHRIGG